ncbi:MAG: TlpA disulfide reductase family protein [Bacteroidota bacterium]
MNKNINILFALLLFLLPVTCAFSQLNYQVSINGKISNNTFSTATLIRIEQDMAELGKSTISPAGEFSIKQNIAGADFYKLEFDKNNFIMMILKPGEEVEISTDAKELMKDLKIKGSEETMYVFKNQRLIDDSKFKMDSISSLSYQAMANPKRDSLMKIYNDEYNKIEFNKAEALKEFMLTHTSSLANLFLPDAFPVEDNLETYEKMDTVLFAKYPSNYFVMNLHSKIRAAKRTRIGSMAPDFTLPDSSGTNVSLSSFKGKYVVIDFWASWCGPCMKEMPNVIKLYNDFHPKGLEILGVSLDKSRSAWLNAIKTKNLVWPQVSDVKFWQSIVVPIYNVSAIPCTVLIDKEGRIIAKNLRGEELYNKVNELLK